MEQRELKIPFLNLAKLHAQNGEEYLAAFNRVMGASSFIGGEELKHFERSFADWNGGGFTFGCGNGTDAITLAAKALRLPEGAEAIVPAMTFFATAEGLLNAGLRLRLVDIHPDTLLMDTDALSRAISPHTKLIVPVHLYGQMAPMSTIREIADRHHCQILEDAAQAHGARWLGKSPGYYGDAATFSFFPGKNLGAMGDGGAVFSRNETTVLSAFQSGNHGGIKKYDHFEVGVNSRLDGLQAALLTVKLRQIDKWNKRRREIAQIYESSLKKLPQLKLPMEHPSALHVYHLYVVQVPDRESFSQYLAKKQIECGIHYPKALHQLPALDKFEFSKDSFPVAEQLAAHGVSLPMCPTLSNDEISYVVTVIKDYFG